MLMLRKVFLKQLSPKIKVGPGMEAVKLCDRAYFYVSYDDMGSFGVVPCNGLILVNNGEGLCSIRLPTMSGLLCW